MPRLAGARCIRPFKRGLGDVTGLLSASKSLERGAEHLALALKSPAGPIVWPYGCSTPSVRGAPIRSDQTGIMVTITVAMPRCSRVRASTGALREQSGQNGVNSATSTPSARIRSAASGA